MRTGLQSAVAVDMVRVMLGMMLRVRVRLVVNLMMMRLMVKVRVMPSMRLDITINS